MSLRSSRSIARACGGTALALALLLSAPASHAQSAAAAVSPFDGLDGSWSGTGMITLGTGEKERIRCRVSYEVAETGKSLRQDLRCASDSYKFDMQSDVDYANGAITGRWAETNRRKFGNISGRASDNKIEALAEGAGFAAFFTLVTRGDQQQFIINSKSTEVTEVSITLRRAGR